MKKKEELTGVFGASLLSKVEPECQSKVVKKDSAHVIS
jgi:hypothetical protein